LHSHVVKTKFTFGDRVRYDSPTQKCTGTGTIEAIVIYSSGRQDYMICSDNFQEFDVQPGILEEEISFLREE